MSTNQEAPYPFTAFISYQSSDREHARWFHRSLEGFALPRPVTVDGRRRIGRVYLDQNEMRAAQDLRDELHKFLHDSKCLVVVCSPATTTSRWVADEIRHFYELGRGDRVFQVLVAGDESSSRMPAIQGEPLMADARPAAGRSPRAARRHALHQLAAGIANCDFALFTRRLFWRSVHRWAWASLAALVISSGLLVVWRSLEAERGAIEESAARHERVRSLVAASVDAERTDPLLGLLLARAARRLGPDPVAQTRLREALRASPERARLRGHAGALRAASFASRGGLILTASEDGTARLWGTDGSEVAVLRGHEGPVQDARFSPSEESILTIGSDGTARLFAASGSPLTVISRHRGALLGADFSADGKYLLLMSPDEIQVVAGDGERQLARLFPRVGLTFRSAEFNRLDRMPTILTASGPATPYGSERCLVEIWSALGARLSEYQAEAGLVRARFSPVGDRILLSGARARAMDRAGDQPARVLGDAPSADAVLSPSGDVTATCAGTVVYLWHGDNSQPIAARGHEGEVRSLRFSPSGALLVSIGNDRSARVWDLEGRPVATVRHDADVVEARISPDDREGLSACADGTVRLWSLEPADAITLQSHGGAVLCASFDGAGTRIVTGCADGTVALWETSGRLLAEVAHIPRLVDAVLSADGESLLTLESIPQLVAKGAGTARLWKVDGKRVPTLLEQALDVVAVSRSPTDGAWLTIHRTGPARLWDREGRLLCALGDEKSPAGVAAFSADGRLVATGARDVRLWERDGTSLATLEGLDRAQIIQLSLSRDGRRVLGVTDTGSVLTWAANGERLGLFADSEGPIGTAAFSPASPERIVTSSAGGISHVRDAAGRVRATMRSPSGARKAAFSPDGRRVLTVSSDGSLRLWDLDGMEADALRGHVGAILDAKFSPDGARVLTASSDGTARLWIADPRDLSAAADARSTREFNRSELEKYGHILGDRSR